MAASPQDTAFSTPIVTVLGDAADQRYAVLQENYQTLGDLAALTAYQGWQENQCDRSQQNQRHVPLLNSVREYLRG